MTNVETPVSGTGIAAEWGASVATAIAELQAIAPLHAEVGENYGTILAGATTSWLYRPAAFAAVTGSGNGVVLGFEDQALADGVIAQGFNDDAGQVIIKFTNTTGGNISMGTLAIHVWLYPIPAA